MNYVFVDGVPLCQHRGANSVLLERITEQFGTLNNSPLPAPVCGHTREEEAQQIVGVLKFLGFRAAWVGTGQEHAAHIPEAPR